MIDLILEILIKFLDFIISLLFLPINTIITNTLPGLNNILSGISDLINYLINAISYGVSWLPLSSLSISIIVTYMIFKLTAPLLVYSIKLVIKWVGVLRG